MGRLDIYISNKGTSQEALDNQAANGGIAPESKANNSTATGHTKNIVKGVIVNQLVTAGINNAKSIIQNQISIYGDMTGDYIKQRNIEQTYNNITTTANMVISAGTAFAVNPILGAVTVGLQALSTGIQAWQTIRKQNIEISKANSVANFNSLRLGAKLVNGNR